MKKYILSLILIALGVASLHATILWPPAGALLYVSTEINDGISTVSPSGQVNPFSYSGPKPYDLAFDSQGNLYICNFGGGTITKLTPQGQLSTIASGLSSPAGLAINNATGEIFVAEFGGDRISRIDSDLQISTFATTIGPDTLAFDSIGNLYTANLRTDLSGDTITRIDSNGNTSVFASGIHTPNGLAFDLSGNLYVSNLQNHSITRITPDGTPSIWAYSPTLLNGPAALAFNHEGYLFVANFAGGNVTRISPDGTTLENFATIGNTPIGLAFNPIPEPSSVVMLIIGASILIFLRKKLGTCV